MATWDDVERFATALPQVTEGTSHGWRTWMVRKKGFVWERPLTKKDIAALGDSASGGEILGASVADLGDKESLLAQDPAVFFTTPHFDGYPAVLVRLDVIEAAALAEVVTDAWLARAPAKLARQYLDPGLAPPD